VKKFNKNNTVGAWHFLYGHPYYAQPTRDTEGNYIFTSGFELSICAQPFMVNPITKAIDDNSMLNTECNVWLESGHCYIGDGNFAGFSHDIELDTGGNTWEEAIINLANLVYEKYGDLSMWGYFDLKEPNLDKFKKVIDGEFGV